MGRFARVTSAGRRVNRELKHRHPHLRLVHQCVEPLPRGVDVDLEDCLAQVVRAQEVPRPVEDVDVVNTG